MNKEKEAFSLIELLVVIAIIGLLSTLSVIALNSARAKARDAKRISDVKQMQVALEMYYNDFNDYPPSLPVSTTIGIGSSTTGVFLRTIPTPPEPYDGLVCNADATPYLKASYNYIKTGGGVTGTTASYTISFCLGSDVGQGTTKVPAGIRTMTPAGVF